MTQGYYFFNAAPYILTLLLMFRLRAFEACGARHTARTRDHAMTLRAGQTAPGRAIGLDVSGVSKMFGSFVALKDVDLKVPAASFHAMLGENGAGKTTLVRCLSPAITTPITEKMRSTVTRSRLRALATHTALGSAGAPEFHLSAVADQSGESRNRAGGSARGVSLDSELKRMNNAFSECPFARHSMSRCGRYRRAKNRSFKS